MLNPTQSKFTSINKNGEQITKAIFYRLKFTDSARFMTHYKVLLIIFMTEFIKLQVNTNAVIKHVKLAELNTNTVIDFLNAQSLKMI